jgi:hypothetical protein
MRHIRHAQEDSRHDHSEKRSNRKSLIKDPIMQLTQCRLLNPNLLVKNPQLALLVGRILPSLVIPEEFPRTQLTMMHSMKHNTHAISRSRRGSGANEEEWEGKDAPTAPDAIADAEEGLEETEGDGEGTEEVREPDAWGVAIADDVADKVGVRGVEEEVPNVRVDGFKDGGVGAFAGSLDGAGSQRGGEIEFFCPARGKKGDKHGVNLRSGSVSYMQGRRTSLRKGCFAPSEDVRSFVSEVRLFSFLAVAERASNPDFVSSQGAITAWGVVGVGGVTVFSSLERRLSLLPASDPAGGVMVIGTAVAMTGDAAGRPVSLGMR